MLLKSMISDTEVADAERIDPRVVRTRQSIEDAFLKLIWKDGFETTTVSDISKEAGINRATFYAHYEDKYALFTHVIGEQLDKVIQTRLPQAAILNQSNLQLLILALIDFFEQGDDTDCTSARHQLLRPMIESSVQERIALLLHTWLLSTPNLTLRMSPDATANLISWTVFGYSLSHVKNAGNAVRDTEISTVVDTILHGAVEDVDTNREAHEQRPSRMSFSHGKSQARSNQVAEYRR